MAEEMLSVRAPCYKEKPTAASVTASGCKTPLHATTTAAPAKPDTKQLKRKLFTPAHAPPQADDDEKKGTTPKRRKSVHSDGGAGSPPALTPGSAAHNKTPGRLSVPLSERQQMALIMQQYANAEHAPQGETSPRPCSPQSAGKKTPLDKKIHKKNEKGETLLHIAAIKGDAKQCKKLIKAGADVNVRDNAGWTPLHEACNHGFFTIAKQLLKNGANVNVQGCDNDTPLHDASGNGHQELVGLLLRHGANPLQQNARGKAPIDIAANDSILRLLKSETIASCSSGDSIASDIRSPTSPESMSEDDDKAKKDNDPFFSPNPRASGLLSQYTSHSSHHSPPTSTSRPLASPPKVDPYDFSDNDATCNPSTQLAGPGQRLSLMKLMKSQQHKDKRASDERDTTHSPKRAALTSGLHGSGYSHHDDAPPPSKRFKSFSARMAAASEDNVTSASKFAAAKLDKTSVLDRLSPASFSSQESDLLDHKLDISAFSSGQRDTIGLSTGVSPLTFANVAKVSSSEGVLGGNRSSANDTRHKPVSRLTTKDVADTSTQPDSQMPKLSQQSGRFSPDSFDDDSEDNALQIDIDSTVPSKPNSVRESSNSSKSSQCQHVASSSSQFHSHSHHKTDVSSSNASEPLKAKKSPQNRSPSPFRFTDSPTSTISPGQSLYSGKKDRFKDNNASSTSMFGGFGSKYDKNKGDKFDRHDKTKHGKESNSRQSPQTSEASKKDELRDHSTEASQSSVKSSGSTKTASADSTRHFASIKSDKDGTSGSLKPADSKHSSKTVPKQEQKDDNNFTRYSPSVFPKNDAKDLKSQPKSDKDKSHAITKQDSGDSNHSRSPKQEKDGVASSGKNSPKGAADSNRVSPRPHKEGGKHSPTQPGASPLVSHKWDANRGSPRPDRGDRDSPKSDKSDKSDNLKVPPLKIIMPAKTTTSNDHHRHHHHHHVPSSTKTTILSRGSQLPYVINPTQDGAEGVVGSSGVTANADGVPTPNDKKNSRSSSRASSVASGGAERDSEATGVPVVDSKNEDSNHGVSSTQQDGPNSRRPRRTDREGPRTEDEESRDGSSKGERGGGGGEDRGEDTSERRVTRSQVRSQKGHNSVDAKDSGKDENGKEGSGSEKDNKMDTSNEKESFSNSIRASNQPSKPEDEQIHIHPRKRKLRQRQQQQQQQQQENSTVDLTQFNLFPRMQYQDKTSNPYEMYLDIRKKVAKRRLEMAVITPKAPQGFKDYLMVNCNYVLQGNAASKGAVPLLTPPEALEGAMKEVFGEQEQARYKLRLQHHIEREKLMLSIEQEIVRVHGRAARALANQTTPLSVCAVLRDEEIYNPINEDKDKSGARQRYNGRQFLSWLQDVDDKFEKIKESLLMRHHHEAESLHAVQKLEWEWRLKDCMLWDPKLHATVDDKSVPMVQVNDEFELLPS